MRQRAVRRDPFAELLNPELSGQDSAGSLAGVTPRELFAFPDPVNETSARLVAAGVAAMMLAVAVGGQLWLLPIITYGFIARVLTGPTLSPLGQLATRVIAPRLRVDHRFVPGPPKRFAQGLGASLSVVATVAHFGFGANGTAQVIAGAIAVAAFLEAAFALCLGCVMFTGLMRVGVINESVCKACVDISGRPANALR